MLLVGLLDLPTSTLFSVSFALLQCLTLEVLTGLLGGACIDLALLLTTGEV